MSDKDDLTLDENLLEDNSNQDENNKNDKVIISKIRFILLCLAVFMLPVLWFFGIGIPVDTNEISVGEIVQTEDGTLKIPISIHSSAIAFTVTTQEIQGNSLIIKPRGSLVGIHHSGSTVISTKFSVDEFDDVYLQGDDENDRLKIYPFLLK